MKVSALVMCVLAVLAWSSNALAQGKGKEKDDGTGVKGRDAKTGQVEKQTGAQKKMEQAAEEVDKAKGKKAEKVAEEADKAKGKKAGKASEAADKGKGKGQEKQAGALQKQQQHDMAKHMEQQARLNRIREIAVKKGDTEMVARVDKLIAKEQEVYTRKLGKLQGQPRAAGALEKAAKTVGGPNDVGALKAGTAPDAQKGKSGKGGDEGKKESKEAPAAQKQEKK